MSLEHRRELKQRARGRAAAAWYEATASGGPGNAALADPRLLRIEQKLDRLARQVSGLPTLEGMRTTMVVLAALAVGVGLVGGVLVHP